ncbi:hypothetical protein KFL_000690090 [Klebsormidium nitens]|uniref:Uncharacterized protein n=1 Tax=Klebsormidium nitens TaxID=105231 RepID=A0A1Y1HWW7_KLENI|nr:hypothetical protein KFL_000690090 [Klebsormidium nitens]|eukprot:GAQ81027.1 hypothetical protein KFL_000690090 [Klebsormidium nitens]
MACEAVGITCAQLQAVGPRLKQRAAQPIPEVPTSPAFARASKGRRQRQGLRSSTQRQSSCCCCRRGLEQLLQTKLRRQGGACSGWGSDHPFTLEAHGALSHQKRGAAARAIGGPPNSRRGPLDSPGTLPEVEIITREGVIRRNVRPKEEPAPGTAGQPKEDEEVQFESSGAGLAEGFARLQEQAARAQLQGERKRAEEFREGDTGAQGLGGASAGGEEGETDPVKARIAAMKKKALEYKAAKDALSQGGSGVQSTTRLDSQSIADAAERSGGESLSEDNAGGESAEDPVKARTEAMKKKALEYKSAQAAPSPPVQPAASEPDPLENVIQPPEESEGGGIGPELALLMSQRRRIEASPYANVIKPLERPSEENMPEIEIEVGNQGAVNGPPSQRVLDQQEDEEYKPKVATWGVFPRPQNISQAYGGGRTIRPGEALISDEEKAARDKKTMALIDAYKKKMGIEMEPALKEKAEKALAAGEALMKRGALRQSLVYFDEVVQETPFRSEVHGAALLNKAVVLDSLSESEAARPLYEKLAQHPKAYISRKAGQMLFGFQAAEKLKFSKNKIKFHDPSVYQKYLSRFSNGYDNTYAPSAAEVEQSARDASKSTVFALAMVGAPLVLIGALIASRGLI